MAENERNELFLKKCRENLERGRAIANGIGVFAAIIQMDKKAPEYPYMPHVLLRLRPEEENDSHLGTGFAGKWELPGGGVEIAHFQVVPKGFYQDAILGALMQELKEETGLVLTALPQYSFLIPAWHYDEEKGNIDLAFVLPVPRKYTRETGEWRDRFRSGDVDFFGPDDLDQIKIVSPRMKFLIKKAVEYASHYWQ